MVKRFCILQTVVMHMSLKGEKLRPNSQLHPICLFQQHNFMRNKQETNDFWYQDRSLTSDVSVQSLAAEVKVTKAVGVESKL